MQEQYFDKASFGRRMRHFRKEKRLTLKDLHDKFGVSTSFLSEVETGKSNPSAEIVFGLVVHYPEVNMNWLFAGEAQMISLKTVNENPGHYQIACEREKRMCEFIHQWMSTHDQDEKAWLEVQFKCAVPEYRSFLKKRGLST